jgi:hypothetical protein
MGDDGQKPPISVDIGLKAALEVKAEVPKESVGRGFDALVDIIRPFTEACGLRADQIRLQRADVAYEIAEKAKQTAELQGLDLTPPPTKFLVPFLEHASLEDQDAELHFRWAALLLSASTHYDARQLTFIDIMSRLSSQELLLLEEVCLSDKAFPETHYPDGHLKQNERAADKAAFTFNVREPSDTDQEEKLFAKLQADILLTYGRMMNATLGGSAQFRMYYTQYGDWNTKFRSLQILERERLVEFGRIRPKGAAAEIDWFSVTYLGIAFVRECSPQGREAVQKHRAAGVEIA